MMADNRRDKRFYFSRSQMILLSGAAILGSAVIFFFGIFVGKNIEERKIVNQQEPLVKIPVRPQVGGSAEVQSGSRKEEITFYDTLTKSTPDPAAVAERPKVVKPPEKLARAEVRESKPPVKEEKAPVPSAKEKPAGKTVAPTEAVKKTAQAAPGESGTRAWTVQVNAFPDERSAKLWVDRLKNKGYNAYVTEVQNRGKTWYRVRVGSYPSREEAKTVEDILKNKENLPKAFATRR
jgi:DedD protein